MKYCLSPREIPKAEPEGSGNFSLYTRTRVTTRGCPDFWWNFKTFISKLHYLFPSQSIFNYANKFLSRSKTSAFRTTIDGGAKNPVGGLID